ncbi:MAG: hypothetical protein P1P84_17300 [Deferrisomatales bacterium]|nr:hypothetical protein [Deferrisomatales bacterium]
MSLQFDSNITAFAKVAANLWTNWRTLASVARCNALEIAIKARVQFMPPITYQQYHSNQLGSFGWTSLNSWTIGYNAYHSQFPNIPLALWMEWVMTLYHESRHAEQIYRVAQGVFSGIITFPTQDLMKTMQAVMAGKGARAIRQAFETKNPFEAVDRTTRREVVRKWCRLDPGTGVPEHAEIHRSYFANFLAASPPPWFDKYHRRHDKVKNAVIDWMKSTHDHHLGELSREAQRNAGQSSGYGRFYENLAEEVDAYGIEGVLKGKILGLIGKTMPAKVNWGTPLNQQGDAAATPP